MTDPASSGVVRVRDLEATLEREGWLSGETFGSADACVLPYVLRLDHLAMSPLLDAGVRPKLRFRCPGVNGAAAKYEIGIPSVASSYRTNSPMAMQHR